MSRTLVAQSDDRAPVALDDLVPSGSALAVVEPSRVDRQPHAIETAVRNKLTCQKAIRVLKLAVHRVPGGVCLEGVMEADADCQDVTEMVREIAGVDKVINHLLILPGSSCPCDAEDDAASVQ